MHEALAEARRGLDEGERRHGSKGMAYAKQLLSLAPRPPRT
jgi:hypothetical protein